MSFIIVIILSRCATFIIPFTFLLYLKSLIFSQHRLACPPRELFILFRLFDFLFRFLWLSFFLAAQLCYLVFETELRVELVRS